MAGPKLAKFLWKVENKFPCMSQSKINRLNKTNFGAEMHIQHRKLIRAKFRQYANPVSIARE